ncbi:hypothetical protein CONPUDRAFT_164934 [Coniophora puteana RWD-64-598 SS2]|uniref:ER membrane protein complex subunit 10 n=1 Tax=Coniophora puteana (strain RWD-64-598) TaxID=741705 RepID=A0A5M3MU70_CONPW|nr:uncharacterized protein CONPUDRAFT_164934 [Coniophora puteana RWD-64-598 SS2]EIW82314.1 hypothetical protein CONPUDRAFT_164934 [Coniophora puteana RWD-64-598 SS2]
MLFLLPFILAAVPVVVAQLHDPHTAQVSVLHRIIHPTLPAPAFDRRGTLELVEGSYVYHQDGPFDFEDAILPQDDATLYQVALAFDNSYDPYAISAVKACHLARATHDALHLALTTDGSAFALDYFVSPTPHNGACLEQPHPSYPVALNTTVHARSPSVPPPPVLREPPPVTPAGEPVQPPAQKSFISKYWLYIVVAVVALLVTGPADEPSSGSK